MSEPQPGRDCPYCPRLADFRTAQRTIYPDWFNAPVPSFGDSSARLLIVGLAPGLKGANRTGRPFTGDYAGKLLYPTLLKFGFAQGPYDERIDDGLKLVDCRITNAVRCVPPANKPEPAEIRACGNFLVNEIATMPNIRMILALGLIAHNAVLTTFKQKKSAFKFAHGAMHTLIGAPPLTDSYHCSRYNTNTGTLTTEMFESVFADVKRRLAS